MIITAENPRSIEQVYNIKYYPQAHKYPKWDSPAETPRVVELANGLVDSSTASAALSHGILRLWRLAFSIGFSNATDV
jgi:hypothetical protein